MPMPPTHTPRASGSHRNGAPSSGYKIRQRSVDAGKVKPTDAFGRPGADHSSASKSVLAQASSILRTVQSFVKCYKRRWLNLFLLLTTLYFLAKFGFHRDSVPSRARRSVKDVVSLSLPTLARRASCSFQPSSRPLPVFEKASDILYFNGPMSPFRPQNQFMDCQPSLPAKFAQPAVVLITATKNPGPNFEQTLLNIQTQSLQNFRWLIIDDHSDNSTSLKRLEVAAKDQRVLIVQNTGHRGLAASRNVGLDTISKDASLQAPYIAMLDDDDLYELTTLEKTVWMLESNPQWSLGSYFFVKFGAQNATEVRGVHNGVANYLTENYVANAAVIRRHAIGTCRYDIEFGSGGEDWDFWLCLADNGKWGGTLPELGYWYRVNDKAFRHERWGDTFETGQGALRDKVQKKHNKHSKDIFSFPSVNSPASVALESFTWHSQIENAIIDTAGKESILLVIPWLYMGGADIGALRMVETLVKQGYRVTVICTLYQKPEGLELRPLMMQWTHDIHILPSFLRSHDFPRYIKYLAETRKATTLLMSNSMLMYEMLPALREQLPNMVFADYLHNEAYDGWKSGGYPTYSILHQRYIDRTISCSNHLKDWMVERGHNEDRIGVVKLGVDLQKITRANATTKASIRQQLYGVDDSVKVVLSVARLDPQKRSLLIPQIIYNLVHYQGFTCEQDDSDRIPLLVVMVGTGSLEAPLRASVERLDLDACFILAGAQSETASYYKSADIFLLPSVSEGISVAVSEAMAAGLPVVAANAGALAEQIGLANEAERAGFVVEQTMDDEGDAILYANELARLLPDASLQARFSDNGVIRVQKSDWHQTLLGLLHEFDVARAAHDHPRTFSELKLLPHPAAHLALQTQLNEFRPYFDFSVIHGALSATSRTGLGRELQIRCGDDDGMKGWIDAVEDPRACDSRDRLDTRALQRSAKHQCGSWCLWDLRTHSKRGWVFNGSCFKRISGNICQEFFNFRPRTVLEEDWYKAQ